MIFSFHTVASYIDRGDEGLRCDGVKMGEAARQRGDTEGRIK